MTNQHYLGDDFYPPIIDAETYTRAKEEIAKRAVAPGISIVTGKAKCK